jgi:hypothetical protein
MYVGAPKHAEGQGQTKLVNRRGESRIDFKGGKDVLSGSNSFAK